MKCILKVFKDKSFVVTRVSDEEAAKLVNHKRGKGPIVPGVIIYAPKSLWKENGRFTGTAILREGREK